MNSLIIIVIMFVIIKKEFSKFRIENKRLKLNLIFIFEVNSVFSNMNLFFNRWCMFGIKVKNSSEGKRNRIL